MDIKFPFLVGGGADFPVIFSQGSLDDQIGRIVQVSLGDETVDGTITAVEYFEDRNPEITLTMDDDDAREVQLWRADNG